MIKNSETDDPEKKMLKKALDEMKVFTVRRLSKYVSMWIKI